MGLFRSKDEKELALAINHLNEFLVKYADEWSTRLYKMISAKAASENPIEKVEPFLRLVWIEAYKAGIGLMIESEKKYQLVCIKTPQVMNYLSHEEFKKIYSEYGKDIGDSVGTIVRELCEIHPEWTDALYQHLHEPILSELKTKAKSDLKDYLDQNREYLG